jgi:hypothetical protein
MAPTSINSDFDPNGKDRKTLEAYVLAKYDSYEDIYDVPL